jgi:hypothetical protein
MRILLVLLRYLSVTLLNSYEQTHCHNQNDYKLNFQRYVHPDVTFVQSINESRTRGIKNPLS